MPRCSSKVYLYVHFDFQKLNGLQKQARVLKWVVASTTRSSKRDHLSRVKSLHMGRFVCLVLSANVD